MEQLLALAYTDTVSDTVVFPAAGAGGSGLAVGGGLDTSNPVDRYVDWLAQDGRLLGGGPTPPAEWFYERVWQITQLTAGVKQITVKTIVKSSLAKSILPTASVVALRAAQF
jgi:hypothetical protein